MLAVRRRARSQRCWTWGTRPSAAGSLPRRCSRCEGPDQGLTSQRLRTLPREDTRSQPGIALAIPRETRPAWPLNVRHGQRSRPGLTPFHGMLPLRIGVGLGSAVGMAATPNASQSRLSTEGGSGGTGPKVEGVIPDSSVTDSSTPSADVTTIPSSPDIVSGRLRWLRSTSELVGAVHIGDGGVRAR